MNGWTYACLVVGLLLLAAPAGALIPDAIGEMTTSRDWVTAGSGETVIITARVLNNTPDSNTPVSGVAVEFTLDGGLGSISPAQAITSEAGYAAAVFTPGTASGDVTIQATVALDASLKDSVDLHIDHAAPYQVNKTWYSPKVTAGGETQIIVRMEDRHKNVVDSKREIDQNIPSAETDNVTFMVGSPGGGAGFVGGIDKVTVPVDENGNATATLQVDTMAGEHLVHIQPPASGRGEYITILGVGNGEPCTLEVDVQPREGNPPHVYAGSNSKFLLTYTLWDRFGNPSSEKVLNITTDVTGEGETRVTTNAYGQALVSYGPWVKPGGVTVTAFVNNTSVACSQDLAFVTSTPTNLFLSANPVTMPSGDVPDSGGAVIRAKVVDQFGNPVADKEVSFKIQDLDNGTYNQTQKPGLTTDKVLDVNVTTDTNGVATVDFWPGAFTTDWRAPGYSPDATGTCKVVAEHESISEDILLTWKNYPYITIETDVTPETVTVNETVDVTIRLCGNGWALPRYTPIDVVILLDRGEGMLLNDGNKTDNDDRMIYARAAAADFARYIDTDIGHWQNNRVGLVLYGDKPTCPPYTGNMVNILKLSPEYSWTKDVGKDGNPSQDAEYVGTHYPGNGKIWYDDYADLKNNLIPGNSQAIQDSLWNVVPMKNNFQGNPSAPLRYGLYKAIKMLEGTSPTSEDSVQAIVVLMQSRYSYYGSPFGPDAGGSAVDGASACGPDSKDYVLFDGLEGQQNLAKYAESKGIQIFPIYYTDSESQSQLDVPEGLANQTGGEYFMAEDHTALKQAFTIIAGRLMTEAGVNTTMDVVFKNVEVNGDPVGSEAEVFDYVPEDGVSTNITSWVDNETGQYVITNNTIDQTTDWDDDHKLQFDVGTIHLNQTWEATFRLKVLTDGNINIFGPGSTITFNNAEDILELPPTFITVTASNNTGMDSRVLNITNLRFTGAEPVTEFLPVAWDLNYTGLENVTEGIFYSNDNNFTWVKFDSLSATNETTGGNSTLDVRDLPIGYYTIRVYGYAPDTGDATAMLVQNVTGGAGKNAYIRIQ